MTHLGARLSGLVDGELGHEARDRVLAHIAGCPPCRAGLESERLVKALLAGAPAPTPPARLLTTLHALSQPGAPLPPPAGSRPEGPVVPPLPAPGRAPLGARADRRRPGVAATRRGTPRVRYAALGALSVTGLLLGTAFAAGAPPAGAPPPVVPPTAELTVEHSATMSGVTLGGPGAGLGMLPGAGVTFSTVARR